MTRAVITRVTDADIYYMRSIINSMLVNNTAAIVEQALKSSDFRIKAAGCVLARRLGKEYVEDLFDGLVDDNELVRQVSRESLMIINHFHTKKKIDFGPWPGEQNNVNACASQSLWKAHFRTVENNQNKGSK